MTNNFNQNGNPRKNFNGVCMKIYLITGGCGFIGSHFIRYVLENNKSSSILNLDALTYAGNPLNVVDVEKNYPDRYTFIKGDITDEKVVKNIFNQNEIDYVIHFAAESHVDRSFDDLMQFVKTNVLGTTVLLNTVKEFWLKDEIFQHFNIVGINNFLLDLQRDKLLISIHDDIDHTTASRCLNCFLGKSFLAFNHLFLHLLGLLEQILKTFSTLKHISS